METQTTQDNNVQKNKHSGLVLFFWTISALCIAWVGLLYFYSKSIDTFAIGVFVTSAIFFLIGTGIRKQQKWAKALIVLLGLIVVAVGLIMFFQLIRPGEALILAPIFIITGVLPLVGIGILIMYFGWKLKLNTVNSKN
jgi:uncharacterized membrane protein HdeD (DUF308 family)